MSWLEEFLLSVVVRVFEEKKKERFKIDNETTPRGVVVFLFSAAPFFLLSFLFVHSNFY